MRHAWIDASAGVAGDMLLGALLDAGADPDTVRGHLAALVPGEVALDVGEVRRGELRATRAHVRSTADEHPHRAWSGIRDLLTGSSLPPRARESALAVFALLAQAEARVHGVDEEQVHFHEVGAWDSIADVVGACVAADDLGLDEITVSPVALGSGRVRTAHGLLPVPVPAVLELARGRPVHAGGDGELATPTGMALLCGLTTGSGPLPAMTVERTGYGAGSRDVPGRPNVVRVVLGEPVPGRPGPENEPDELVVLETNVDDMDPRVWPHVLQSLLDRGAADAWLTPILMKKGRPAHTLHVLARPDLAGTLRAYVLRATSTLGVRESAVARHALGRTWAGVTVEDAPVRIKLGVADGRIVHATPEYDDVAALAAARELPLRQVLEAAVAAADAAGLRAGAPVPGG